MHTVHTDPARGESARAPALIADPPDPYLSESSESVDILSRRVDLHRTSMRKTRAYARWVHVRVCTRNGVGNQGGMGKGLLTLLQALPSLLIMCVLLLLAH